MLFWKIISWIATFGVFIAGIFSGTNNSDFTWNYKKDVESVAFYENDFSTAVPQTEMYKIMKNHLYTKSADGKTKKLIVLGYDGCRADNLTMCGNTESSAIMTLLADGGSAKLSYCGGVNYPQINTQATSTAPGWCSMLTGEWADVHGIKDNGIVKSNDNLTLLTTAVEDGTAASSAFYVSWGGHFSGEDSTYALEKKYIEEKGLNASFVCADGDDGTYSNVMNDVRKENCSDFIFSIFEYCDHTGHSTGFCKNNPEQKDAFADVEKSCKNIIDAIKSRPTYDSEDWMIIITSDHGGYNSWHGGPTMQERYTFIVSNKQL